MRYSEQFYRMVAELMFGMTLPDDQGEVFSSVEEGTWAQDGERTTHGPGAVLNVWSYAEDDDGPIPSLVMITDVAVEEHAAMLLESFTSGCRVLMPPGITYEEIRRAAAAHLSRQPVEPF